MYGSIPQLAGTQVHFRQRVISTPGVVVITSSENSHLPSVDEAAAGPPFSESRLKSIETRTQTETAREELLTPPETSSARCNL
jgi:hypothetical protein